MRPAGAERGRGERNRRAARVSRFSRGITGRTRVVNAGTSAVAKPRLWWWSRDRCGNGGKQATARGPWLPPGPEFDAQVAPDAAGEQVDRAPVAALDARIPG